MKTIYVSEGQARYVGGTITETTGKDISTDPIVVGLGGYSPPPAKNSATSPTVDQQGDTTSQRVVKLLVNNSFTLASNQYVWAWVTDNPEVEPIRIDGPINIV